VAVDLTSAITGTKLYDDSLRAGEWFAVKTKPSAEVRLRNFKKSGNSYMADAELDLKDVTVTVPFNFNLDITEDAAAMSGSTKFTRKSLQLGQESDANADWVSEEIKVTVNLTATSKN